MQSKLGLMCLGMQLNGSPGMAPCNMRSDSTFGNGERFHNCECRRAVTVIWDAFASSSSSRSGGACTGIPAGQARGDCLCKGKPTGRYQDTELRCSGGVWCYGSGASYVSCAAGLLYDTAAGGVCNWASAVQCNGRVAAARATRRAARHAPCSGVTGPVPCVPAVNMDGGASAATAAVAAAAAAVPVGDAAAAAAAAPVADASVATASVTAAAEGAAAAESG